MIKKPNFASLALAFAAAAATIGGAADDAAPGLAPGDVGDGGRVVILPLQGPIDKSMLFFLRRGFERARDSKVKALILDMDTPGGRLDITEEIITRIREFEIPVYTYVNTHAQSAGAIISLATDEIFMAPPARIGSAMPILMDPLGKVQAQDDDMKEKIRSDLRAMVRGLAQENGYLPDLAMAMVDPDVEVKIGERIVSPKGNLINLTALEAVEVIEPRQKPLLATAIVEDVAALLAHKQMAGVERIVLKPTGSEKFAQFLTMLAPLLLIGAGLGIYIEFKTPGFGLPGIVGIVCLVIFLFGHYVAGMAGQEDMMLVILGLLLLAIELFVLPGFGICGVLGIGCILTGIFLSLLPHIPRIPASPLNIKNPFTFEYYLEIALIKSLIAVAATGIGGYFLAKILPQTSVYSQLILQSSTSVEAGYIGTDIEANNKLLGERGVTVTDLRPAGIATISSKRVDVVTKGDFIQKGEPVVVREVQGPRIVVVRDSPTD